MSLRESRAICLAVRENHGGGRALGEEYTPFKGVDEDGGNMRRHRARWEGFSKHVTLPTRQWLGR